MSGTDRFGPWIDNTDGNTRPRASCLNRARTIRVNIRRRESGNGYSVWLTGSQVVDRDSNPLEGHLEATDNQLHDLVADLLRVWNDNLIGWRDQQQQPPTFPVAKGVELVEAISDGDLNRLWRIIAKAGNDLFRNMFFAPGGDERLHRIGRLLTELVNGEIPHVITFDSNVVVAPWAMLYVPPEHGTPLTGDFAVDPSFFIGYRHQVEHSFRLQHDATPHVMASRRVVTHAYVDHQLDQHQSHEDTVSLVVKPVLDMLREQTNLRRQGSSKRDVVTDMSADSAIAELIYFCCHCSRTADGRTLLRLGDDQSISGSEISSCFSYGNVMDRHPLVFINACDAGFLWSPDIETHFGMVMLQHGASCLLGPHLGIPRKFAGTFAKEVLEDMLGRNTALGEVIRDRAAHHIDKNRNPLGLAYTSYHGIDSHFCANHEHDNGQTT